MAASRLSAATGGIAGVLGVVAASLALVAPPTSLAATIGLPLPAPQTDVGFACGINYATCTYAQELLAGKPMRAAFTGTIKRFQVQGLDGTIRLLVLRKRDDGQFKAVRRTRAWPAGLANTQVATFPANLAIRKRDFIGISLVAPSTRIRGAITDTQTYCKFGFGPALEIGAWAPPSPDFSECGYVVLYNARIVR